MRPSRLRGRENLGEDLEQPRGEHVQTEMLLDHPATEAAIGCPEIGVAGEGLDLVGEQLRAGRTVADAVRPPT